MPGSPDRTSFTPGRVNVSPSDTQGGSRVPELGSLGSVRGALSNGRPYRDLIKSGASLPGDKQGVGAMRQALVGRVLSRAQRVRARCITVCIGAIVAAGLGAFGLTGAVRAQ